jgi:hypothetical protein
MILFVSKTRIAEQAGHHTLPSSPGAGVKNADEAELKLLASRPLDITLHNVLDFPQLATLAGLLSRLICQKVQGRNLSKGPGEGQLSRGRGTGRLWLLHGLPGQLSTALRGLQPPPGTSVCGGAEKQFSCGHQEEHFYKWPPGGAFRTALLGSDHCPAVPQLYQQQLLLPSTPTPRLSTWC